MKRTANVKRIVGNEKNIIFQLSFLKFLTLIDKALKLSMNMKMNDIIPFVPAMPCV